MMMVLLLVKLATINVPVVMEKLQIVQLVLLDVFRPQNANAHHLNSRSVQLLAKIVNQVFALLVIHMIITVCHVQLLGLDLQDVDAPMVIFKLHQEIVQSVILNVQLVKMTFHVQPVLVLGNSQARLIVNVPQNSGISLQLHSVYLATHHAVRVMDSRKTIVILLVRLLA